MGSSSTESESMSDYEISGSPPPAVIDADEEEIMSVPQNTMNIQDPKMKGPVILDVVPLTVVPYGGKEPSAFDKEELGQLGNHSGPVKAKYIRHGKQQKAIPLKLLSLNDFKEADWTAFFDRGVDGQRRDWTFKHRQYCRTFRSKKEVKQFLESNGPASGMFKGKKLHKKSSGVGCRCSTGTSKSTSGRKAANYARGKSSVAPGPSTKTYLPHGPLILDAVPLRVVPYGGTEPIAFDKENIGQSRNQFVPVKALYIPEGKQKRDIPLELLSLKDFKEEDWTAFFDRGVDGQRRDWTYKHMGYCRSFRSKMEVKRFLESNGPATGMFKGKKLHKKKIAGLGCHDSAGTSKSTSRRKAANYARGKLSVAPSPPTKPYFPHSPVILDVVPLSVVPYGGMEPISFDKENVVQLRNQTVSIKALYIREAKQKKDIPLELLSLKEFKEGNWTAFFDRGVDGQRRDWTYKHRDYCRTFRSKKEVKRFLESNGPETGMFKGKKLHKKKIAGLGCHDSAGTSKSTSRRKAANYARGKVPVAPSPSINPYLPHGFV